LISIFFYLVEWIHKENCCLSVILWQNWFNEVLSKCMCRPKTTSFFNWLLRSFIIWVPIEHSTRLINYHLKSLRNFNIEWPFSTTFKKVFHSLRKLFIVIFTYSIKSNVLRNRIPCHSELCLIICLSSVSHLNCKWMQFVTESNDEVEIDWRDTQAIWESSSLEVWCP